MKQERLIKAYLVLDKLSKVSFPLSISCKIFQMKELIEPQYKFQDQEEKKSFSDNNGYFNKDNKMSFPTIDDYRRFDERMKELRDLDVDIAITPITIPINDNILLSANDVQDLRGFVDFI